MNYDEMEQLWASQPAAPRVPVDAVALRRKAESALRRQGRMLWYGLFVLVVTMVVTPLVTWANFRHAGSSGRWLYWIFPLLSVAASAVIFVFLAKCLKRHRKLRRQPTDTMRALTLVALANLESEMRDYRRVSQWMPALILLQCTSLLPVPPHHVSLIVRALVLVGFDAFIIWLFWRDQRVNVRPEYARQKELLRQMAE